MVSGMLTAVSSSLGSRPAAGAGRTVEEVDRGRRRKESAAAVNY
jgi:hypothetical protein